MFTYVNTNLSTTGELLRKRPRWSSRALFRSKL